MLGFCSTLAFLHSGKVYTIVLVCPFQYFVFFCKLCLTNLINCSIYLTRTNTPNSTSVCAFDHRVMLICTLQVLSIYLSYLNIMFVQCNRSYLLRDNLRMLFCLFVLYCSAMCSSINLESYVICIYCCLRYFLLLQLVITGWPISVLNTAIKGVL